MRIRSVAATLGALCLMAALGAITPADAGLQNTFVVEKVVVGPVPAGAVFEVEVTCDVVNNVAASPTASPETFQFDATGAPIGANSVSTSPGSVCTAVETVTNGATVSYGCAVVPPDDSQVVCNDDQTVSFLDIGGAEGTVTVTNTFEPEPPPAPAAPPAPAVVAARPAFTG